MNDQNDNKGWSWDGMLSDPWAQAAPREPEAPEAADGARSFPDGAPDAVDSGIQNFTDDTPDAGNEFPRFPDDTPDAGNDAPRFGGERSEAEPVPGWSEMRFAGEREERQSYSDAGYVPAGEACAVPRTYHCADQGERREKKEKKPKRERRGVGLGGLIAACLVCAILGGLVAGFLPGLLNNGSGGDGRALPATEASSTVLNVAAPATESATQVSTNLVTDSREKTATEIYYELATKQTVAITTEITYTNIWGYRVPSAVKGSGFIISSDGYILTNHHVIKEAVEGNYEVKVLLYDGSEYVASVIGYEEDNDVAVLKIDATGLSAVTLGDSDQIKVGETAYAVGNPLGELEFTMTSGMVSATDREISSTDSSTGISTSITMFQVDVAINSGNSGGPIYNSRGEVIGIATAKYADTGVEGLGFAIPINDAVAIARDLITDGYVHGKASFGVSVGTVTAAAAQYYGLVEGAIVASVTEGSAAETAGLKENDIIVALNGETIASRDDLVSAKRNYRAGDTVELKVWRSGEYLTLSLTFDEEVPTEPETATDNGSQNGGSGYGSYGGYGNGYGSYGGYGGYGGFYGGYPFS